MEGCAIDQTECDPASIQYQDSDSDQQHQGPNWGVAWVLYTWLSFTVGELVVILCSLWLTYCRLTSAVREYSPFMKVKTTMRGEIRQAFLGMWRRSARENKVCSKSWSPAAQTWKRSCSW